MFNSDDLDAPRPKKQLLDLQQLSVEDLKNYILSLETEISRAQDAIDKKQAHRSGAAALFGGGN